MADHKPAAKSWKLDISAERKDKQPRFKVFEN
jgi:hypothetical protein